jgi:hypothetical protein
VLAAFLAILLRCGNVNPALLILAALLLLAPWRRSAR